MLWVEGQYKIVKFFSVGFDFWRHNLTENVGHSARYTGKWNPGCDDVIRTLHW